MGVGVFEDNFGGTGGTFIVSPPLVSEDDYRAALAAANLEWDMGFEAFAEAEASNSFDFLCEVLLDAAKSVGGRGARGRESAGFCRDFLAVARGRDWEVGVRSWQHDFIVGFGPSQEVHTYLADPEWYEREIRDGWALSRSRFCDSRRARIAAVGEYARLACQLAGLECRFRASGYTSGKYSVPVAIRRETGELRRKIRRWQCAGTVRV